MSIHRRATLRPALSGLCLLWAPAAFAGSFADWVSQITEWDDFDAVTTTLLTPYRDWLAGSEILGVFHDFATSPVGGLVFLGFLGLIVAFFTTRRRRRGYGDLTLRLVFPDEIEGAFDVSLRQRSTRKSNAIPTRRSRRNTRSGVCRETQFDQVKPGHWFLSIQGTLRAPLSNAKLLAIDDEIEVEIIAGRCLPIDHTLPDTDALVEVCVEWDQKRARDVGLRIVGVPDSFRHASRGTVKTRLAPGTHPLVIGAGDRVIEQKVEVTSFEPLVVPVDLAAPEGLIFKGCPPAVSPFLQGELEEAACALERDGQADVAALIRARLHQEEGQTEHAAEQLEQAGRVVEAAELRREMEDFDRAAALFEDAGEIRRAAEMYDAARAWTEAASAYTALEDWAEAARCFEAAGDTDGLIGALEKQGEPFRAAALATEHGDRAGAIRLLQLIGPTDPEFGTAGELLALAYEQEGHFDLAANQLERCLDALAPGEHAPQIEIHLSELLEDSGEINRALGVLEALRDRDPTFPRIASRIESLRKKLSGTLRDSRSNPFASTPSGATAFIAQDRYEILEEIGRGGMGLVYKARDRRLERTIALKRMPENLREHPSAIQLFLGEAQAAARMNHPNIVTLYDADQENGSFFITMELLEGLPLNVILKERGRFGPRDTARLGLQVCAGLQFAHEQGIVHRDIKTSNLFITRDRVLKIMDFGLAKILEAVRKGSSTIIAGTPFYMAPEQAAGRVADGRTDLYALGVTLFELSTGRLPFVEGDVAEQHRNAAPPDPAAGLKDYPAALANLIQRMMSKSPEDRPAHAEDVASELARLIEAP